MTTDPSSRPSMWVVLLAVAAIGFLLASIVLLTLSYFPGFR